ncbi:MAG TPA: PDZ domain-containing protein, partial [Terriglobales bacterium]|nr:PDZ domain-containing protein [Terriglobales bacterium]
MSPEPFPISPDEPAQPVQSQELPPGTILEASDPAETSPRVRRGKRGVVASRVSLILVAILAGSALFVGGFSLGSHVATTPGTPADEETRFGPFWDVYSLITSKYAGSPAPDQDKLTQAAINGMMQSLNDPYSYYQAPADFQDSLLNVGGQAEGIGVQVKLQPVDPASTTSCSKIGNGCELAVDHPIPGSPAEAAGIAAGDVIVSVNGTLLDGKSIDDATA